MELYVERGFDETTVAEIAKRAGLTERTFFRHFADKREVLFAGAAMLQDLFVAAVGDAAADLSPVDAAIAGVVAGGALDTGTAGLRPPALRDHCGQRGAAGARAHQAGRPVGAHWPARCGGAACPTTPPAWRPRWRSPSSGWRSSAGSPTRSGSTCPSSCVRHSTSSVP